jgi:phenylalanyl-tRNA synthetase alpha chain
MSVEKIESLEKEFIFASGTCKNVADVEALRIKFIGKKGSVSDFLAHLGEEPPEEKPIVGKRANELKNEIITFIKEKEAEFKSVAKTGGGFDITLPGTKYEIGQRHPLTQVMDEICAIFRHIGFKIVESPEIETEFNNFTALNIPLEHPSRDAFDTFYLESSRSTASHLLLRSHTSPGQVRVMKQYQPPLAVVVPGRVYRPDAVDASHSFMFHQVEGFLVDKEVRFSDLKGVLTYFCQELFGKGIRMRFRPHFFPFTEPSAEVDISCIICEGKGCSVCGRKGWLEILGSGMIHPNVFKAVGYPKDKYTGFAFGMGVERIAMLKYGINDIRLFFENDLRFLRQF